MYIVPVDQFLMSVVFYDIIIYKYFHVVTCRLSRSPQTLLLHLKLSIGLKFPFVCGVLKVPKFISLNRWPSVTLPFIKQSFLPTCQNISWAKRK